MKTWFITGASRGFGRAVAEEAIRRGDRLVVTARKPDSLQDLVDQAPDRVLALALDVTDAAQIERATTAALDRFGAIDVLYNNAGTYAATLENARINRDLSSALPDIPVMTIGASHFFGDLVPDSISRVGMTPREHHVFSPCGHSLALEQPEKLPNLLCGFMKG